MPASVNKIKENKKNPASLPMGPAEPIDEARQAHRGAAGLRAPPSAGSGHPAPPPEKGSSREIGGAPSASQRPCAAVGAAASRTPPPVLLPGRHAAEMKGSATQEDTEALRVRAKLIMRVLPCAATPR